MDRSENGGMSSGEAEVMAKATRRRFTGEYKLRILREAEGCTRPGEIGALLRREGLYSSSLTEWRKQRERGELEGLLQKRRGPAPKERNPVADKVRVLERENARLRRRAERAEGLVALQKKVSEVLGIGLGVLRMDGASVWSFSIGTITSIITAVWATLRRMRCITAWR